MRTRTRLTTAPGTDPTATTETRDHEHYVPGLALPREPHVAGRLRRVWLGLAVLAVFVVIGFGMYRAATSGQTFDPALDPANVPAQGDDTDG